MRRSGCASLEGMTVRRRRERFRIRSPLEGDIGRRFTFAYWPPIARCLDLSVVIKGEECYADLPKPDGAAVVGIVLSGLRF